MEVERPDFLPVTVMLISRERESRSFRASLRVGLLLMQNLLYFLVRRGARSLCLLKRPPRESNSTKKTQDPPLHEANPQGWGTCRVYAVKAAARPPHSKISSGGPNRRLVLLG